MQALFSYHSAINIACLVGTKHLMQRWRCLHQKVSFDTYPGQLMLPSFVGHIQLCLRALWLPWLICFLALSSNLLLPRTFFFFWLEWALYKSLIPLVRVGQKSDEGFPSILYVVSWPILPKSFQNSQQRSQYKQKKKMNVTLTHHNVNLINEKMNVNIYKRLWDFIFRG